MEALFECRYVRTPEMHREFYRYWFFRRPALVICYACMGASFLLGVVDVFLNFNVGIALFLPPLTVGLMYCSYLSVTRNAQRRDLEISGGKEPEVRISLLQDALICHVSNGATAEIPLSKIKKVVKLQNQFVLVSDAKMLYSFHKDSFTVGTPMELEQYLQQKGLLR